MNIGIIGAGNMGAMHARILKGLYLANVTGLTAWTGARARKVAEELQIKHYESCDDLIRARDVDIVDICAPTGAHARLACEAMLAGKHAIVEFPACRTARELNEMRNVSVRTGKTCAVAYTARFHSQYRYLMELAKSDRIGAIAHVSVSRKSSRKFLTNDIVGDLMSQDIDFVVELLGKPKSIAVKNDGQHACAILMKYDRAVVSVEGITTMPDAFPSTTRHVVTGEKGSVELDWSFDGAPRSRMTYVGDAGVEALETEDYDPYRYELERIVAGIENERAEKFDIESVAKSMGVAFACRKKCRR